MGGLDMQIDWNAVGTICGSLGGFAVIAKWVTAGVEKSNETLPVIMESLKNINETAKTTNKGLEALFDSRNDHEKRLVRVENTHDLKGCNEPFHVHQRQEDKR